ncbi:hypothetical protein [Candidatus Methylacidiphilum infernorum]|uniref:Uncharacterized protein n=1 Tax=Methylacidiphilum infernorum (isolate V4) TaxID=481448 RepID=B3E0R5_METI4|nr:hypothetical protein [Candidatus Methylacidiphilum infernorum]ACD82819.1 Hypothetical protein Minf_0764 [Methylacidiphilum infernorum V4]
MENHCCCAHEKEASLKVKEGEQKNCPSSSANLVDRLVEGWHEAACQAWEEVLKEILKEKIRLKWGAELERGAQAYVESMDKSWLAKITAAKAEQEFRQGMIKALFKE